MVDRNAVSTAVRSWTDYVRTRGFDTLWQRMTDADRDEFVSFARDFDGVLLLEDGKRWQHAVDIYKTLADKWPAFADIAIQRAAFLVDEKINRAIRYYNTGVRAMEMKKYDKALECFSLALHIDPFMENAIYNAGMAHKTKYVIAPQKNRSAKVLALDCFRRVLDLNPAHRKARAQLEQLERL